MMPKVIGNDSLIARVNEVQGCMYRQSNELGRLNKAVRRYKEENAKLRELVLKNWYIALSEREALRAHDIDPDGGTYMAALDDEIATAKDRMRELGIEVGE